MKNVGQPFSDFWKTRVLLAILHYYNYNNARAGARSSKQSVLHLSTRTPKSELSGK